MEDNKKLATISTGSQALVVIPSPKFVHVGALLTEENEMVAMLPLQADQNLQLIQALEVAQKELDPDYKTREDLLRTLQAQSNEIDSLLKNIRQ